MSQGTGTIQGTAHRGITRKVGWAVEAAVALILALAIAGAVFALNLGDSTAGSRTGKVPTAEITGDRISSGTNHAFRARTGEAPRS